MVSAEREHLKTGGREGLSIFGSAAERVETATVQLDMTLQRGTEALVGG